MNNHLGNLNNLDTSQAVQQAANSLVRVEDGSRLTATGIIWEPGVIVTTSHGTESDEGLTIQHSNGATQAVTLLGRDDETDIAVLRITGEVLPDFNIPMPRATEESIRVGSLGIAVALPGNKGLHATLGLVSARQAAQTADAAEVILRTDALLLPGFSGGALVNLAGEMIGMVNCLYGRGLGVAIGTRLIQRVVETLTTHGKIPHGYLGVRLQSVSLDSVTLPEGRKQGSGLLLIQVDAGSPAATAGLLLGDTLLNIGDVNLESTTDIRRHLYAGQETHFTVLRGGQVMTLSVIPGSEPTP
jgi:serine protease DegQ